MLFGLAFLAVGLLFVFLFLIAPTPADWATPGNVAALVSGFLLLGAILACVRIGVVIDRHQRIITTWWGLLVPFHKTEHPFSQAHYVTLSREERQAGDQTYEVFPVRLEGADTDTITIHEPHDHDKARHLAEDVAKFVHLGVRDRSSGQEVAREAGALDQSLQQRLGRAGRSTPLPVQPSPARAILSYGGTRAPTTIEIPPLGRSAHWFLMMMFIIPTRFAFLLVLGISLPLLIRNAILRERLVVSPDELVVTRHDIFGTRTTRLRRAEVEEVEMTQVRYPTTLG